MATITEVSGRVVKCEVCRRGAIDWNYTFKYSPNTEHYDWFLNIQIETADGQRVFFNTPRVQESVSLAGSIAVVTFNAAKWDEGKKNYVFPEDHPWFRIEGETESVASPGKPSKVTLKPKVAVGDVLKVKGRIKKELASGFVLNHVQRI